jgi:ferredoxin
LTNFVHGYVYARWPYHYIGLATGARRPPWLLRPVAALLSWLFSRAGGDEEDRKRGFADRYHGKVVPTAAAQDLVRFDRPIELRGLEQVIPYRTAVDIVLQDPDHIVALECPCRSVRERPCRPLDVCLIVGEPFAEFVVEHHPTKARRISADEAAGILRAERDRGHVHHAFFKDAMLSRFYAICNCCSCCCGAIQAWRNGTPMLESSGYVAVADSERCVGCGACAQICPFDAIEVVAGRAVIDRERCMGCGVCVAKCPQDALGLERDPEKSEPLSIREMVARDAS